MNKQVLKVVPRKVLGRRVKRLRAEGVLPGNVYGKKVKSKAIQLKLADFEKVYKKVGETGLVELIVNSDKKPVLIHNVQTHPVTDLPIHIDFLQVDLKEKVKTDVPVELVGESPAEKTGVGTVVQYLDEIEVEALPGNLPEKFEIDLSKLSEVDQAVQVKDLRVDAKKVEIQDAPEQIVVKVEPPREEEEAAPSPKEEEAEEVVPEEAPGEEERPKEKAPSEEKEKPGGEKKKEASKTQKS